MQKTKLCSKLEQIKLILLSNRVAHGLQTDFEQAIGNLGSEVIDTKKLSSGAKINLIFHER